MHSLIPGSRDSMFASCSCTPRRTSLSPWSDTYWSALHSWIWSAGHWSPIFDIPEEEEWVHWGLFFNSKRKKKILHNYTWYSASCYPGNRGWSGAVWIWCSWDACTAVRNWAVAWMLATNFDSCKREESKMRSKEGHFLSKSSSLRVAAVSNLQCNHFETDLDNQPCVLQHVSAHDPGFVFRVPWSRVIHDIGRSLWWWCR